MLRVTRRYPEVNMSYIMDRLGIVMLATLLVTACVSIPEEIRNAPADSPAVGEARDDIESFTDTRVRWGGTIAEVTNRESETWIEVVARALQDDARPRDSDSSQGRFLARFEGFLDPAIYSKGRELTVVGAIEGKETREIDQYDYEYPVVDVESHYLWDPVPEYPRGGYRYSPYYYYDPFYDPFFYDPFLYSPFYWRHPYWY
jgi:outer membrane lipoprotein